MLGRAFFNGLPMIVSSGRLRPNRDVDDGPGIGRAPSGGVTSPPTPGAAPGDLAGLALALSWSASYARLSYISPFLSVNGLIDCV